jgi:hypothetical protein|tara:strand:- start:31 stop:357 length:327 start_codon:yes stop_codon:yes gene_type:complete
MSDLRVTNLRGRTSGSSPTLPDGVVVTGVTTSTSAIVGSATTITTGGINVTGVVTATSAVVGTANTLSTGGINVTGVVTATSFTGSGSGLTGLNIPAGFSELDAALFN